MQIENTSIRLKQIMKEKQLRQVDLLEMLKPYCEKYNVKINKSDISQYLSGKVKPGQEKLSMLGMALGVTESWLMGYDTAREKEVPIDTIKLSKKEKDLLDNYNKLNDIGKNKLYEYSNDLVDNPKYLSYSTEFLNAAHDDDLTEEEKQLAEQIIKETLLKIKNNTNT